VQDGFDLLRLQVPNSAVQNEESQDFVRWGESKLTVGQRLAIGKVFQPVGWAKQV